jgi:uncharacterized protein (DUF4415 family)
MQMTKSDSFIEKNSTDLDDAPKLTREWAAGADVYRGGSLIRRGRPRLENPKRHVSLRLDPDILETFRATGPGWQRRINTVLRKAAEAMIRARKVAVKGADRRSSSGSQDRHLASGREGYEVNYFARKHGISKGEAEKLIERVGNDRVKLNQAAAKLHRAN